MLVFSIDMMLRINCFYSDRQKLMFQCEYCGPFIRNVNDRLYLNVNQLVLEVTDQEEWSASRKVTDEEENGTNFIFFFSNHSSLVWMRSTTRKPQLRYRMPFLWWSAFRNCGKDFWKDH